MTAPCLCGHEQHHNGCWSCGCVVYSPDYVAAAKAAGEEPEPHLRALTMEVAAQRRWRRPGVQPRPCAYCLGWFYPRRAHARTCSGACRVAMHRALSLETDDEVLSPVFRRDCYARDRWLATGWGLLTPQEQYEADLRVRQCQS